MVIKSLFGPLTTEAQTPSKTLYSRRMDSLLSAIIMLKTTQIHFFTEGRGHITFLDTSGIKTLGIDLDNYLAQAYRIIDYNNDYYVSGLTENANDYGLIKLDSLGNILWHRTYGGGASDHCFGMAAGEDGSIFLTRTHFI